MTDFIYRYIKEGENENIFTYGYASLPLMFALVWIVIYCIMQSLEHGISSRVGIYGSANAVLTAIIALIKNKWYRDIFIP